jgi:hypothetical protein
VGEGDVVRLVHSHGLETGEHLHTRILGHVYIVLITIKNKHRNKENKKHKLGPEKRQTLFGCHWEQKYWQEVKNMH